MGESSANEKVTHHAIVGSKKPAGSFEPTIYKRTPLMGKVGPNKRSVRMIQQNLYQMTSVLQHANNHKTYSRLWGSWTRIMATNGNMQTMQLLLDMYIKGRSRIPFWLVSDETDLN